MGTDEFLLPEMSVLCRKSDFTLFEGFFFFSLSVSSVEPGSNVQIPEWLYLPASGRNLAWCLPVDITGFYQVLLLTV